MFKRYIHPLLVILLLSFGLSWLDYIVPVGLDWLIVILRCLILFYFGITLSSSKRHKNQKWLPKVIISLVLLIFLILDLGYVYIPKFSEAMSFLGIEGYIIYLIYIYCGYCFFD